MGRFAQASVTDSFFSCFLLKMAEAIDPDIEVDIFDPWSFQCGGLAGCNHCGGIVSESLVQILAAEGIRVIVFRFR